MQNIREATLSDNEELLKLQNDCPMGTKIILSSTNVPNFFSRANRFESNKIFVACHEGKIIASGACAIHSANIHDSMVKIGYLFQFFISQSYRRKGIPTNLYDKCVAYFKENNAEFVYLLVNIDNHPLIKGIEEKLGFVRYRTLIMPSIITHKTKNLQKKNVRLAEYHDLASIVKLLNDTWNSYQLYVPFTVESLIETLQKIHGRPLGNLHVIEENKEIIACMNYWDLEEVSRITVKSLDIPLKWSLLRLLLNGINTFYDVPPLPQPGDQLKCWILDLIGFSHYKNIATLTKYLSNKARNCGINQLSLICDPSHPLLKGLPKLGRLNIPVYFYIKTFGSTALKKEEPVFISSETL